MEQIVKEPNVEVYYRQEARVLVVAWRGEANLGEYKFAYQHALLFAKKGGVKKLLLNQQQLTNPNYRARTWLMLNFFPSVLMELGMNTKIAFLPFGEKTDTFSSLLLKMKKAPLIKVFKDEKEAMAWLDK